MLDFLFLFWLHFIGDYPLQPDFLASFKGKYDYILFCHAVIWTGTIAIGLYLTGNFDLWKVAMLFVGHFLIDRWKARKKDKTYSLTRDLWIDQGLHFVQLALCLL